MTDIVKLKTLNAARWKAARLTRAAEYQLSVSRALAAKPRYMQVSARTGVHWVFTAVIHYRECSQNFSQSLAQGDPWNKVSVHVPKGRGPFSCWEDCAVDALVECPPYASKNVNWTLPDMLTLLEMYNGLGYANRGIPSPYLWSGTNQYVCGKYIADGKFDASVVDKQLGVAGFIMCLLERDPTILNPKPVLIPPSPVEKPHDLSDIIWDWIVSEYHKLTGTH